MSTSHSGGNIQPGLDLEEHDGAQNAKRHSLISEVTTTGVTGSKSSVGTSAVQMISTSTPTKYGVVVKAVNGNTGKIYVGFSSSVTNGSSDATDGFELGAGESIRCQISDVNVIYVIASTTGQKVSWISV